MQVDHNYHVGSIDLLIIPNLGLVTYVSLDYMHLVCLAVMKKLFRLWMFGYRRVSDKVLFKMESYFIKCISKWLESITSFVPTEFSRKPRTLKEIKNWKATEFRQILLYTGVIVFRTVLRKPVLIILLNCMQQ